MTFPTDRQSPPEIVIGFSPVLSPTSVVSTPSCLLASDLGTRVRFDPTAVDFVSVFVSVVVVRQGLARATESLVEHEADADDRP